MDVVNKSDLPENIKQTIQNARKYAEGRGISIEVKDGAELETVKQLVEIKVGN